MPKPFRGHAAVAFFLPWHENPRSSASSKSSSRAGKSTATPGLLARVFSGIGRGILAMIRAWRATDAQVKRDALAFIVLAIAVLVALREWFGISGQAGDFIHLCAAGFVGIFSVVLPIILVAFSVELVRVRSGNSALPHRVAGSLGVVLSLTGLVHVSKGNPAFDSAASIENAGGILGWFIARPLVLMLSSWGAAALLILLFLYSILLGTRTQVAQVPTLIRECVTVLPSGRGQRKAIRQRERVKRRVAPLLLAMILSWIPMTAMNTSAAQWNLSPKKTFRPKWIRSVPG